MPLHLLGGTSPMPPVSTEVLKRSISASKQSKILAENRERKGLMVFNHGAAALYIDFGSSVSINDFAVMIPPGCYYEMLFPTSLEVRGVWSNIGGKAFIREFN
jgi:hypothetical protein